MESSHSGPTLLNKSGYEIVECQTCQFIHVKIPANFQETLNNHYSERFFEEEKPDYIKSYLADELWWTEIYRRRIKLTDEYRESLDLGVSNTWLDIGSGPGLFLETSLSLEKNAVGIEPSKLAHHFSISRGNKVINAFFDEKLSNQLRNEFGYFDAVHVSEVLEHIPEPMQFLEEVKKLMRKDSLLVICVPNDFNTIQTLANVQIQNKFWWIAPPSHLNYFTPPSLALLLERCGFELIRTECTFPIDIFLLLGKNYVDIPELGPECHSMRKSFEFNLLRTGNAKLLNKFYEKLFDIQIGREILVFCRMKIK